MRSHWLIVWSSEIIIMVNGEWDETLRRNALILKFAEMTRKNENIWQLCKTDFCVWHLLDVYWITIWLAHILFSSSFYDTTTPNGPGFPHCQGFTITFRHITLGWTPLDEGSNRCRELHLKTDNTHDRHPCSWMDSDPQSQQGSGRTPTPWTTRPLGSATSTYWA